MHRYIHVYINVHTHTHTHGHTHRYKCIYVKAGPTKLTGHRSFVERDAEDAMADDITLSEAGLLK